MFTVALYKVLQASLHNNDKQLFMLTLGATAMLLFFFTTRAEKYSISSEKSLPTNFFVTSVKSSNSNIGKYSA